MTTEPEAKVLCLYVGGTLGMIRHPPHGYKPYPGFLTETLRTQTRFHDPRGDSIFSWSDTTDRYRAWTAYNGTASSASTSRNNSGASTPIRPTSPVDSQPLRAARPGQAPSAPPPLRPPPPLTPSSSSSPPPSSNAPPVASPPPFAPPLRVLSSSPEGVSTAYAVDARVVGGGGGTGGGDHVHLDMLLPTLVTPRGEHGKRVRYAVLEYDPLLDSSNIEIPDWLRLARDISLNYRRFDAFVVLHGTDTMAYTASALSMLLENLGKTVVITGAQVPLSELRNDAIENVLGALTIAGNYVIAEVALFFASTLLRGNRTTKVSNSSLRAFASPNHAPLARAGISIDVDWRLVRRPTHLERFRAHGDMCGDVAVLRLFPGLGDGSVRAVLESSRIRGVVLQSYGAGNAPTRPALLEALRDATRRGVCIVNITQCLHGEVSALYAVGKALEAVGVVPGGDMTPECALAKLSYLLAKPDLSPAQVRALMGVSLRGELTERTAPPRWVRKLLLTSSGEGNWQRDAEDADETDGDDARDVDETAEGLLDLILGDATTAALPSLDQTLKARHGGASAASVAAATELGQGRSNATIESRERVREAQAFILPYLLRAAATEGDARRLKQLLTLIAKHGRAPRSSSSDVDASLKSSRVSRADESASRNPDESGGMPSASRMDGTAGDDKVPVTTTDEDGDYAATAAGGADLDEPSEGVMRSSFPQQRRRSDRRRDPSPSSSAPTTTAATRHALDASEALHAASAHGRLRCARLLLLAGASVHAREGLMGRTPLYLAARAGHVEVVRLLRSAGAWLVPSEAAGLSSAAPPPPAGAAAVARVASPVSVTDGGGQGNDVGIGRGIEEEEEASLMLAKRSGLSERQRLAWMLAWEDGSGE